MCTACTDLGPTSPVVRGKAEATSRIYRKVALLHYDPFNPADPGEHVSDVHGVLAPDQIAAHSRTVAAAISEATAGVVNFEITDTYYIEKFPVDREGVSHTWESFMSCYEAPETCHVGEASYNAIMVEDTGANLCEQIRAGVIDEVWVWAAGHLSKADELAYKVPGDAVRYPVLENGWIYDLRKKDLPECGRTYFVMHFNTGGPGGAVIHSIGHRIESALTSSEAAQGHWGQCDGLSEWTDFVCVAIDGGNPAGCGNVHFPPNGTHGYDYDNEEAAASNCDSWLGYPNYGTASIDVSKPTWMSFGDSLSARDQWSGSSEWNYLLWWFSHIPRAPGSHQEGGVEVLNNWWHYILCYDGECATVANVCGDGSCGDHESAIDCPQDCSDGMEPHCGDGSCEGLETFASCPSDCPGGSEPYCGDGSCQGLETFASCPDDCPDDTGPYCGDGSCNNNETNISCPSDCPTSPDGCDLSGPASTLNNDPCNCPEAWRCVEAPHTCATVKQVCRDGVWQTWRCSC